MFIHNRGNLFGIQGRSSSSSSQGMSSQSVSFSSFSFSASIFSSQALNGLSQSCGREPQNVALQTLSSLFSAMSVLSSFQGLGGRCGTPPPQQPGPAQQGKIWDVFFDAKSGTPPSVVLECMGYLHERVQTMGLGDVLEKVQSAPTYALNIH